jgi:hypothetical protein
VFSILKTNLLAEMEKKGRARERAMAIRNKEKCNERNIFPFLAIKLLRISLGYLFYFT